MVYWIAYLLFVFLSKIAFPLKIYGKENIPPSGGVIFASNHLSNLDPMIVGLCMKRRLAYFAKEALFKNKLFAFFLRKVEAFPTKRSAWDIRAVKESIRRLKLGYGLVIFPEGTRKSKGGGGKVFSGVGFLAVKSGMPLVPVFLEGSDRVMPPGKKVLRRSKVNVLFGQEVPYSRDEEPAEITRRLMEAIHQLSIRAKTLP